MKFLRHAYPSPGWILLCLYSLFGTLHAAEEPATGLVPIDAGMCFVAPDKAATLSWKAGNPGQQNEAPYIVFNYEGAEVGRGNATVSPDRTLTITRTFLRGYSEIRFPEAGQTFGIVSLEPHEGPADPFFCMDGALSWLEKDPARRTALVKIAARSGVAMSRERLGLGGVNPDKGTYHWEGTENRSFETLRKTYADNHLPILEILEGGGEHIGHVNAAGYARNHPELAATIADLARHWPVWGGAEVDNEPDLKPFSAEQYVPSVKSMSYGLSEARSKVPLVAGVFATIPPGPFFDTCVANGMLEDTDVVSFHSYDRAPSIEAMVARYRAWLKAAGKGNLPLWHTECGWSWARGPERPPQLQDAISAMEITAKGVETMACGVARYFPFVYVYYDEGQKNFGMMGREATPLRSMAAYAMSIQTLSGKKYRGDLSGLDSAATLARVFGTAGSDENVAVLYTGKVDKDAKIAIPAGVLRVAGADGRTLLVSGGMLPIPDGLAYAWMDAASLQKNLKTDTPAMALYQSGQHPLEQKRLASPLVLQFMAEDTPARTSARRYLVTREVAQAFPLHVRIHNLSREPVAFTPEWSLPGESGEKAAPVSVPALGSVEIAWKPDISASLDIAQTRLISIYGKTESGAQPSPLAIPVVMDGTMEEHLKRHKNQTPLPIAELGKWKQNIAADGKTKFTATAANGILADFTFAGAGGWWTYPKLELPGKIDATLYSGLLVRARIMKSASPLAIIADPGDGSPSFWVSDLFPADGEWHVVYVPFAEFKPGPNGTGNQNTRLNPASWKELCVGMGSNVPENSFEMSHLLLVGGSGD